MYEWYTPVARQRRDELERLYGAIVPEDVARAVERALERQEKWVDRECVNLNPASNLMNPRAERLMSSTASTRPSLGHAGEKYETGLAYSEEVEHLASSLACRLFGASYAETRALSGAMANLMVYMACAKAGDSMLALAPNVGGHATHQSFGMAGLYGLQVHAIPWDAERFDVDLPAFERLVQEVRPRIVLVGASLVLKSYDLPAIAKIAHAAGAVVQYDAAHMAGVIAGGVYPNPLANGADVMTMSTYKMYGGPPGGLVLTNDPEIAKRIDEVAYPGLTANFDVGRVAALAVATADLLAHGKAYARDCVANAQALAQALERRGVRVVGPGKERTQTHHVLVDARPYGGGDAAARRLEPANVISCAIGLPFPDAAATPEGGPPGLRLGTPEVTRLGMGSREMERIAGWIGDVLIDGRDARSVADEVRAMRARFQIIGYVVEHGEPVAAPQRGSRSKEGIGSGSE